MAGNTPTPSPTPNPENESEMTKLLKTLPELQEQQEQKGVEAPSDSLTAVPEVDPVEDLDAQILREEALLKTLKPLSEPIIWPTEAKARANNATAEEIAIAKSIEREDRIKKRSEAKAAELLKPDNQTNLEHFMKTANLETSDLDTATFILVVNRNSEAALKYLPRYYNKNWALDAIKKASYHAPITETQKLFEEYEKAYQTEPWWNDKFAEIFEEAGKL